MRLALLALAALSGLSLAGTASCHSCADEREEEEERDMVRDHFWRARIHIVGAGTVKTPVRAFDCTSDGASQRGDCGPKLVTFKELSPPTMKATGAPGWRLDHWESSILEPDGASGPRPGRMPDGRIYLNGFGYSDTNELETVTAVFVRAPDGGDDLADDAH